MMKSRKQLTVPELLLVVVARINKQQLSPPAEREASDDNQQHRSRFIMRLMTVLREEQTT